MLPMAPVVTVKAAEVAAAATVTDGGVVNIELLSDSVTAAPPVGAGWVSVTVQVLEELATMLDGRQLREETSVGATRLTVVLAELLL